MKRLVVTIFLYAISFSLVGATELSIGVIGSLDFYNYKFKANPVPGFNHQYKAGNGYSGEIVSQIYLNDKFAIRTGLLFSSLGYKMVYSWISPGGSNGTGDPAIPMESRIQAAYIGIPLLLSCTLLNKEKIDLSVSSGGSFSLHLQDNETSVMGDGSEKKTDFINEKSNTALFSGQVSVNIEYWLSDHFFISLSPFFNYGFNKLNDDIMLSNPISYGGALSFNYHF